MMKPSTIVIAATAILIETASANTIPPDAPNQPPFSLSSLQQRCDDQTGAAIVASVGSEYHFTLRPRSEINLPSEIPLTIRVAYRGGALTCYPAIIPPEGSTRPQISAQVGVVMHVEFFTEGGAFSEQFETEFIGRSGGVNFSHSTTPEKLQGTYRPDLPGYADVSVGFVGYFGGDLTNGEVNESGIPPGHVSEYIPVARWATYLDQTPAPTSTPTPTPAVLPCVGDCNGDRAVTVDEIVRMVNIALDGEPNPNACPGSNQWCNSSSVLGAIGITCLIDAVDSLLTGCPTPTPTLSLSVHMARNPDTQILQAVADLTNSGEVPVSYLTGCSAQCRPKFYRAVSFELVGPHNTEVIVEEPCGGVLLCPEGPQTFSPGESVEQTLDISGIEWKQDTPPTSGNGECGSCTQAPLEPGRYKVTARFQYSTDLNNPWGFTDHIETSAEFDWP